MPPLSTSHIFISYSRRDTEAMQRLVSYLRGQGLKAWVDNEKLVPGTPIWEREIEKAIDAAYAVVVVLSPDAKESVWVLNELTLADEFKKRVFPVLVRGDFRESIHFRLVTRQFVDLRTNEESGLESLSAALGRYLDELKHLEEEHEATERKAEQQKKEEVERLDAQKAEEERIAKAKFEEERLAEEKAKVEKKAKEESDRLAAQKMEKERVAQAKRETDRLAEEKRRADNKAKAEKKAKEEADRLAAQKAEQARIAKAITEEKQREREKPETQQPAKSPAGFPQIGKEPIISRSSPITLPKIELTQPIVRWAIIGVIGLFLLGGGIWGISSLIRSVNSTPTEEPVVAATSDGLPNIITEEPGEKPTVEPTPTEDLSLPPFEGKSLVAPDCDYGGFIKSIEATERYTVTFSLCKPDPAFLSRIAMDYFAIYPEEWIEATTGNGTRTSDGLESPAGTGPYMVDEWNRGDSLTFTANPNYWGSAPKTETLVFRWLGEPAGRLLELQSGTVDGIDDVDTDDFATILDDSSLSLKIRPSLNVVYIGMTNTFAPFDNQQIRQAIAMGIDRQHIVDSYYPFGTEMASHFVPCYIPNGCEGDKWYDFDPEFARALLAEAGYPDGFSTRLYYRDVFRSYLPSAGDVAQDIQDQLREYLNINAEIVAMDSGTFIQELLGGQLDGLYLYGWSADYPHPISFMEFPFDETTQIFGNQSSTYYEALKDAVLISDSTQAKSLYTEANNAIREYVPMIPVAHTGSGIAYRADVANQQTNALGIESFAAVAPNNRDVFIWMQANEPDSLFCADEWSTDSVRACAQIMESLYSYDANGIEALPALAEQCVPVDDLTWMCTLRRGVIFHDGTTFDANDVVTTFTMGLDASSPLHVGNTNEWSYYDYIWGLMNLP